MSKPIASPDITALGIKVRFDISGATPVVRVTNDSTVVTAANIKWIFEVTEPTGYVVNKKTFSAPDINGTAFTSYNIPESLNTSFGTIQFNKQYIITVRIKDSNNNEFSYDVLAEVAPPFANNGENNFGGMLLNLRTDCGAGRLFFSDSTLYQYKTSDGSLVSQSLTLTYPNAGAATPAPVTVATTTVALPISYDAEGYNVSAETIKDYALSPDLTVRIKYKFYDSFPVQCSVFLCPLICEIDKIREELAGNCDANTKAIKAPKLAILDSLLLKAVIGKNEPLCKIDVRKTVAKIKEIGGFECSTIPPSAIAYEAVVVNGVSITTQKVCGDISITPTAGPSNSIILSYSDKSYVIQIGSATQTATDAFTFTPVVSGCTNQFNLDVDLLVLAEDIVNEFNNSTYIRNYLTQYFSQGQVSCPDLDGRGIVGASSCDYSVEVDMLVSGDTIESITIGGTVYDAPDNLLISNASGVQTWLNGLSKGTFAASIQSTQRLYITTTANPNLIESIQYTSDGGDASVNFVSSCQGLCYILQGIIDYLFDLNLLKVKIGGEGNITVCYINDDLTVSESIFTPAMESYYLIKNIAAAVCQLANLFKQKLLSCENIKTLFTAYNQTSDGFIAGTDAVLMNINGKCRSVPLKQLAISTYLLTQSDTDVKTAYCAISACPNVAGCDSVSNIVVTAYDTSAVATWNGVVGAIGYKWSKDNVTWNLVTSTSANITGLTSSTAYILRVYPVYTSGDAPDCTATKSFTTSNVSNPCAAPANLVITAVTSTTATVSYNAVSGATGYAYSLNGGSPLSVGNVLTFNLAGLVPSTLYNISVFAIMPAGPCAENTTDDFTTTASGSITGQLIFGFDPDDAETASIVITGQTTAYSVSGTDVPGAPPITFVGLPLDTYDFSVTCTCSGGGTRTIYLDGTIIVTTSDEFTVSSGTPNHTVYITCTPP